MIIDYSGKRYFLFFRKKKKTNSKIEKINLNEEGKMSQAMLNCFVFSISIFSEIISNLKIPSLINNNAVDSKCN